MRRRAFLKRFAMGVMASGMLADALVRGKPEVVSDPHAVHVYVRRAIGNFTESRAADGSTAFAELNERIRNQMWKEFAERERRYLVDGSFSNRRR